MLLSRIDQWLQYLLESSRYPVDDIETKDNEYKRERNQRKIERGNAELFHGKKQSLWVSCNTLLRRHSLSSIHEEGMIRPPAPAENEYLPVLLEYCTAKLRDVKLSTVSVPIPHYSVFKQQLMKTKICHWSGFLFTSPDGLSLSKAESHPKGTKLWENFF